MSILSPVTTHNKRIGKKGLITIMLPVLAALSPMIAYDFLNETLSKIKLLKIYYLWISQIA